MSTEGNDCSFEREGKICIDLPISVVTSGTNNQVECEDGRGECIVAIIENSSVFERRAECNPRLEAPGGPEMTMEKILESDVPLQSYSVIQCNRNYGGFDSISGGSSMEEYPPSTPRENVVMVPPPTHPFPSSPSFSNQPPFEDGDSSTESDGEQTGPTRRKRSNLKQRTRRSLVLAVEAAGNPPSVLAPVAQPEIPFFLLTEAQQRQYAWALCKNPRFSEDPMGLVDVLISDTPEYLVSELKAKIGKLVFDINGKEVSAEDPANQIGRNLAAQAPLSIHSRETRAREQLQLVVYGQKPSGMVVYQEMRSKVKYKPKVFLDPMTINTFDKLMLQGGEVKDADHADENWVEARKLWSDRAHHFNCTMRQVQGHHPPRLLFTPVSFAKEHLIHEGVLESYCALDFRFGDDTSNDVFGRDAGMQEIVHSRNGEVRCSTRLLGHFLRRMFQIFFLGTTVLHILVPRFIFKLTGRRIFSFHTHYLLTKSLY